jgi:hypothetical protein
MELPVDLQRAIVGMVPRDRDARSPTAVALQSLFAEDMDIVEVPLRACCPEYGRRVLLLWLRRSTGRLGRLEKRYACTGERCILM